MENLKFWCSRCQNPKNKQRCPRSPEEFAQIGLEIGVFKEDFTSNPFKEDHPQNLKSRKSKRSANWTIKSTADDDQIQPPEDLIGANPSANQDITKSTSDVNDAPGVSKKCL